MRARPPGHIGSEAEKEDVEGGLHSEAVGGVEAEGYARQGGHLDASVSPHRGEETTGRTQVTPTQCEVDLHKTHGQGSCSCYGQVNVLQYKGG